MLNLSGLILRIQGQYQDAFLYGGVLYLVCDEHIRAIDFVKLIEDMAPKNTSEKILFKYAFLHNDFFYKADNEFYDFFNIPSIRKFLQRTFDRIGEINIPLSKVGKHTIFIKGHNHPGVIHLEVYKNTIFLSDDSGTYAYKKARNKLRKTGYKIIESPAVQITAELGNTIYFACAEKGLISAYIPWLSNGTYWGDEDWAEQIDTVNKPIISVDCAYRDLLLRDINNNYLYGYDLNWNADKRYDEQHGRQYDPERRRYREYSTVTPEPLKAVDFASSLKTRLLTLKKNNLSIYRLNFDDRRKSRQAELDYDEEEGWQNQSSLTDLENTYIYSGYQTVFGLVLDTDKGTIVIDDDCDSNRNLVIRRISKDENVKVRHFYRSINYSHIIANIKNNRIELYSDLTDYFFPKEKKKLRRIVTRREALQG